jgi:hypothetical protein
VTLARNATVVAMSLSLAACSSSATGHSGMSEATRAYMTGIKPTNASNLSLHLPPGVSVVSALSVPAVDVQALNLSPEATSLSWLRGQATSGSPTTDLVSVRLADASVSIWHAPKPILMFRSVGERVVLVEQDSAPSNACATPPCERLRVTVHDEKANNQDTVLTEAAPQPIDTTQVALASFAAGAVYQLQQRDLFVTYVWRSGASQATAIRSDRVPAVTLTVVGRQVVGQYYGRPGLWTSPLDSKLAAPLPPEASKSGSLPIGTTTHLAWFRQRGDHKTLMISALLSAGFGNGRAVPSSEQGYASVWLDPCALLDREADGLFLVQVCQRTQITKQRIFSSEVAANLYNPARFDATLRHAALALQSSDGRRLTVLVLRISPQA